MHEVLVQRWLLESPAWEQSVSVTEPLHWLLRVSPTCTPALAALGWDPGLASLLSPSKAAPRSQKAVVRIRRSGTGRIIVNGIRACDFWFSQLRMGGITIGILSIVQH